MSSSSSSTSVIIAEFARIIAANQDPAINLLRIPEVVMWLFGDTSFLPAIESKNKSTDTPKLKALEDEWGRATLKTLRPDLRLDKQWTNKFGEHIASEICHLNGHRGGRKPRNINHFEPDWEVDEFMVEAKAGTFFTEGTAHEKVLGCPFKYADVPDLYGKPLKIICMGGAEKKCREQYGNLPGTKCTPRKQRYLEFVRESGIEFVAATDMIRRIIDSHRSK